jgi:hypothetical protein
MLPRTMPEIHISACARLGWLDHTRKCYAVCIKLIGWTNGFVRGAAQNITCYSSPALDIHQSHDNLASAGYPQPRIHWENRPALATRASQRPALCELQQALSLTARQQGTGMRMQLLLRRADCGLWQGAFVWNTDLPRIHSGIGPTAIPDTRPTQNWSFPRHFRLVGALPHLRARPRRNPFSWVLFRFVRSCSKRNSSRQLL